MDQALPELRELLAAAGDSSPVDESEFAHQYVWDARYLGYYAARRAAFLNSFGGRYEL